MPFTVEPTTVKSLPSKPANCGVEPAAMKPASAAAETSSTAAMKTTAATAMETPAPAMRPSVGEIWLAEHADAQQSHCSRSQSPSDLGPGCTFA
jgi:hypothetical protein